MVQRISVFLQEKQPEYMRTEEDANQLSAAVWRAAWPRERLQQRAFFTFGQKMLLALDLQVLICVCACSPRT